MKQAMVRRWRMVPLLAAVAAAAGCGGGGEGVADSPDGMAQLSALLAQDPGAARHGRPPQLAPAQPALLAGTCADLPARLATLPNTTIASVATVAAGALTVGGNAVREHCLVKGSMHARVSAVDGKSYAIGFEMRLPTEWNGRFLHQGNGGIDGAVVAATGATGPPAAGRSRTPCTRASPCSAPTPATPARWAPPSASTRRRGWTTATRRWAS
jgi:hypothetical protein